MSMRIRLPGQPMQPVQPLAPVGKRAGGIMPVAPMPMQSPMGPVSLDTERYSNRPLITKFNRGQPF